MSAPEIVGPAAGGTLAGVGLLATGLLRLWRYRPTSAWPVAAARVVDVTRTRPLGGDAVGGDAPLPTFEYRVGNQEYRSQVGGWELEADYPGSAALLRVPAETLAAQAHRGEVEPALTVRYHPRWPRWVVPAWQVEWAAYLFLGAGVLCLLGVAAWVLHAGSAA